MSKNPAYQWYVPEWLASPTRKLLSKAARSAYRDLLDYCWDGGCKLPDDPEKLRILADCTEAEWKRFGEQILKNFMPHSPGFITNAKLLEQWKQRKAFIRSRMRASKLGVKARKNDHHVVNYVVDHVATSPTPTPTPNKEAAAATSGCAAPPPLLEAFLAIGHHVPFGPKRFQEIWSEEWSKADPQGNWVDVMETTIQRCTQEKVKVPREFYKHKKYLETNYIRQRYKPTPI